MNNRPDFSALNAFLLVATRRSFRQAADELGVSPSTLSHMLRGLEDKLAVRLLNRTTRSVSPTEAGERLISQLAPALQGLDAALSVLDDFRQLPAGGLRINASEEAARMLLQSIIPDFSARFPQITLDLVTDGRLVDIVKARCDAGIRLLDDVPQDMIAVPFGPLVRFIAVASPEYIIRHGEPQTPDDLQHHRCIRFRMPSGKRYRWEFSRHGQERLVDPPGILTLDHPGLMAEAAAAGMGIAWMADRSAHPFIVAGRLRQVLVDWSPPWPGLALYYPGHRYVPPALRALIEAIRRNHQQSQPEE